MSKTIKALPRERSKRENDILEEVNGKGKKRYIIGYSLFIIAVIYGIISKGLL